MATISLRNLTFLSQTPLFQDLNLVIGERDRLAVVARNGAGKSTLLRCLAGLVEPTHGEITRGRGMRIGLVEQDVPDALLDLSMHEAVLGGLPALERDGNAWRVDMVLDEFETPEAFRTRPVHIAQRRLAAARAHCPRVDCRAGRAAARRTHQPSRSREAVSARSVDRRCRTAGPHRDRQPRPGFSGCLHQPDAVFAAGGLGRVRSPLSARPARFLPRTTAPRRAASTRSAGR